MSGSVEISNAGAMWGPAERAAFDRCARISPDMGLQAPPRRLDGLSRTIESEIIPRLMLVHRAAADEPPVGGAYEPTAADVAELARLTISQGLEDSLAHVAAITTRGTSLETIMLGLLDPTARLLGDMWAEDLCDFADVTIGLSRLQQVLRAFDMVPDTLSESERHGRVLLAPVPGEQHGFGLAMLETFFRNAGWGIADADVGPSLPDLCEVVRAEWIDAVGLSLSGDVLFDRVRPTISALRKASRNPRLLVMVGGRFFNDNPRRAAEVGADVTATSAPEAIAAARACLKLEVARN